MSIIEAIMTYPYLQNAYFAGMLIAFISPFFGVFVVAKRASLIPDTLGHVSFAASTFTSLLIGLGILPFGTSPLTIVMLFAVLTALVISYINTKFSKSKEVALSFVMTFSLGIAIVMYQLSNNKTDLSGYLFGNIVALSQVDVVVITVVVLLSLLYMMKYYKNLQIVTFDSVYAHTRGLSSSRYDTVFFIILALIIASSTKFVGVLLVSALMNLPVMIVMQFTKSFKQTIVWSIIVSEIIMLIGLISSYYLNLPTSGVVAMLLGIMFITAIGIKSTLKLD